MENESMDLGAAKVLHGHTSVETAHLTFAYPFGFNLRCLRREWLEQATTGMKMGEFRFVTQTTSKAFNVEYSDLIESAGEERANEWAQRASIGAKWNAPKASTYLPVAIMIQAPLKDESGRLGVAWTGISGYGSGPENFEKFLASYGNQLDEKEIHLVRLFRRAARKVSPSYFAEHEAESLFESIPVSMGCSGDSTCGVWTTRFDNHGEWSLFTMPNGDPVLVREDGWSYLPQGNSIDHEPHGLCPIHPPYIDGKTRSGESVLYMRIGINHWRAKVTPEIPNAAVLSDAIGHGVTEGISLLDPIPALASHTFTPKEPNDDR